MNLADRTDAGSCETRTRIVVSETAALAVDERGPVAADAPTVLMTHGWPDSSAVWDDVADRLADRFHVVTFDARGIGRSTPAMVHRPYALPRMANDIAAVIAATSPDRPVHIVGHDWGSVEAWEYVADPDRQPRAMSFTSVSGPCLDHLGASFRNRLQRPTPRNVAAVLAQSFKSAYVVFLHLPVVSSLVWRVGGARLFRWWMRRVEGVPGDGIHPAESLPQDAINGMPLYRTNILPRLMNPRTRRTAVPVQLIVATKDHYVTPRLFEDVEQWAPGLRRRDLEAGHWAPRTHPDQIAEMIADFVDSIEADQIDLTQTRIAVS